MFKYKKPRLSSFWFLKIKKRKDFNRFLVWLILNKVDQSFLVEASGGYADRILIYLPDLHPWWISINEKEMKIDLEYQTEIKQVRQAFIKILDQLEIADYYFFVIS